MREKRVAQNELLFRQLNEQIRKLQGTPPEGTLDAVCECGNDRCFAHIPIPAAEYERLRSDKRRFVVVPGHELLEVETVVERREGFFIVEKHDDALRIANANGAA